MPNKNLPLFVLVPLAQHQPKAKHLDMRVVSGILHSENNPTALVGIKLVHEGDAILGAKVLKIYRDKVEFEKDGFSWTQRIMEKPEPK